MIRTQQVATRPTSDQFSRLRDFLAARIVQKKSPHTPNPTPRVQHTHTSFAGGKYCILEAFYDKFLRAYVCSLLSKEPVFLVELRTPIFPFFMDLDIKSTAPITAEYLHSTYLRVFQRVLVQFYSDNTDKKTFQLLVLDAPTKQVPAPDPPADADADADLDCAANVTVFKSGFHLHWFNLYVTAERALILRRNIITALEEEIPVQWPSNPHEDAVDKCVYEKNGLRMFGSDKVDRCKHCRYGKVDGVMCPSCYGMFNKPSGRVYTLRCALDYRNEFDQELLDQVYFDPTNVPANALADLQLCDRAYNLVGKCSVRTTKAETPGFAPPDCAIMTIKQDTKKQTQVLNKNAFADVSCNPLVLEAITQLIRTQVNARYAGLCLKDMMELKHKKKNRCYLVKIHQSEGAWYCQNVQRAHNSSTIYFTISENDGLRQRCYSKKNHCNTFASRPVRLPTPLQRNLFPVEEDVRMARRHKTVNGSDGDNCTEEGRLALQQVMPLATSSSTSGLGKRKSSETTSLTRRNYYKNVNTKLRDAHNSKLKGTICTGVPTQCGLTWGEIDTFSFAEIAAQNKKRRQNEIKATNALRNVAPSALRDVTELLDRAQDITTGNDNGQPLSKVERARVMGFTSPFSKKKPLLLPGTAPTPSDNSMFEYGRPNAFNQSRNNRSGGMRLLLR